MPPLKGFSDVESSTVDSRVAHWQRFLKGDFDQKWNSSKLIVKEGKNAIAPLLTLLNDPSVDAETHWFTIRALGHFPEPDVIAAIAAQIDSSTAHYINRTAEQATELSAFAIETLAAMGSVAIAMLSQLLKQPQQRLLAAKALNQVRSSGVIPAMVSIANDKDANVRYYAIDALGSFRNATITPVLLAALDDFSAPVRKAAVMALGRRQDLQADYPLSQRLQALLWDVDLGVSCQAALALGRLAAANSLEALKQVLLSEHTPMPLRIDTVRALDWYCDRPDANLSNPTTHQAFTVLTDALKQFGTQSKERVSLQSKERVSLQSKEGVSLKEVLQESVAQKKAPPANVLEQRVFQALTTEELSQLLVAIVRVMGDLRHGEMAQKSTQCLIEALQTEPAAVVVQAIVMALAGLGQPQTFNALLPLLNHPVDAVLIHTIAALKRLDPDQSFERVSIYLEQFPDSQPHVSKLW